MQLFVIWDPTQLTVLATMRNLQYFDNTGGPGSSVGIVTELRAGRSGDRIPVGARFFATVQTGPGAHPASCTMGTESFPGVNSGRGVTLTPHPILVPLVMKESSYTSTPPMGRTACTEHQCLFKGALYRLTIQSLYKTI